MRGGVEASSRGPVAGGVLTLLAALLVVVAVTLLRGGRAALLIVVTGVDVALVVEVGAARAGAGASGASWSVNGQSSLARPMVRRCRAMAR